MSNFKIINSLKEEKSLQSELKSLPRVSELHQKTGLALHSHLLQPVALTINFCILFITAITILLFNYFSSVAGRRCVDMAQYSSPSTYLIPECVRAHFLSDREVFIVLSLSLSPDVWCEWEREKKKYLSRVSQ